MWLKLLDPGARQASSVNMSFPLKFVLAPAALCLSVNCSSVLVAATPVLAPFRLPSHCPHLIPSSTVGSAFRPYPDLPTSHHSQLLPCPFSPGLWPWPSRPDLVASSLRILQCFLYVIRNKIQWLAELCTVTSPPASLPSTTLRLAPCPSLMGFVSYHPSECIVCTFSFLITCLPHWECRCMTAGIFVCLVFCFIPRALK